jgi:uncharacterized protein (DUF1015 family)
LQDQITGAARAMASRIFRRAFSGALSYLRRTLMATIRSFAALCPEPKLAGRICELPYDVMSSEEARQIAAGEPLSFLHVSKPEIDFTASTDAHAPEVYARGRENFDRLIAEGALRQDAHPCLYLYRQEMARHSQVGVVAVASCAEYLDGAVRKHELTRPDKEDDRVRHMEALNAQTGPVFLTYPAVPAVDAVVAGAMKRDAAVDFVSKDAVRHTSWRIDGADEIRFLEGAFSRVPFLYIADGHHRSAAAARVCRRRHGAGQSSFFLSVLFPHNQLRILSYNRVVKDLNGLTPRGLLERLEAVFSIGPAEGGVPVRLHDIGLHLEGRWHTLTFRSADRFAGDPARRLDVALLQALVLGPVFGIEDPRTSHRVGFVGGIRGTEELERLVRSGEYACAFSMFPTSVEDLMTISDAGGIMPPKSTWFEPKLRDGMFCHRI